MTALLVWTLLFSTLAFGQAAVKPVSANPTSAGEVETSYAGYLMEVSGLPATGQSYTREVQTIARMLSSTSAKNPVLIDDQGYARETVLQAVAARLESDPNAAGFYARMGARRVGEVPSKAMAGRMLPVFEVDAF